MEVAWCWNDQRIGQSLLLKLIGKIKPDRVRIISLQKMTTTVTAAVTAAATTTATATVIVTTTATAAAVAVVVKSHWLLTDWFCITEAEIVYCAVRTESLCK